MTSSPLPEEDIVAVALRLVQEGDLNTLTIRKVKELVKQQISVEDSYDDQLTELVKVAIDRHITSLQQQSREDNSTKKTKKDTKQRNKPHNTKEIDTSLTDQEVYHQLTKVCRQLGVGLPINKLKGVTEEKDKIEIVKEYLRKKGVKRDPLVLTDKQVKSLRAKLDREKELQSLDTSNILKESNKRRRRDVSFSTCTVQSYSAEENEEEESSSEEES